MDEVKKKIWLDMFASPVVLMPMVGGITCLFASWANDGPSSLAMAGAAAVLIGGGICITRIVFGLESMTQKAWGYVQDKEKKERQQKLDELDHKLNGDRDKRTTLIFRNLRALYDRFNAGMESGKFTGATQKMIAEKINELYQACVKQLEHSYELYVAADGVSAKSRRSILAEREKVISEVADAVDELSATIEKFFLTPTNGDGDVKQARLELERTLEVAKSVENRMNGMNKESDLQS